MEKGGDYGMILDTGSPKILVPSKIYIKRDIHVDGAENLRELKECYREICSKFPFEK